MELLSNNQIAVLRHLYLDKEHSFTYEELKASVDCVNNEMLTKLHQFKVINRDSIGKQSIKINDYGVAHIEYLDAREEWEKEQKEYREQTIHQAEEANVIARSALKRASRANIIAIVSLIVSVLISIGVAILSYYS